MSAREPADRRAIRAVSAIQRVAENWLNHGSSRHARHSTQKALNALYFVTPIFQTVMKHSYDRALHAAWADHLGSFAWHHFITLTSETPVGEDRLKREFRKLIHRLERITKSDVAFASVVEAGVSGLAHIHALIWCSFPMPTRLIESKWTLGITHVRRCESPHAAAAYLAKDFTTHSDDYSFSTILPPRLTDPEDSLRSSAAP